MKKITIKEAIIDVLRNETKPLSSQEIYSLIVERKLYHFNSKTPISIINSVLRKNCTGIDLKKSNIYKVFEQSAPGKFSLIKNSSI